MGRFGIRMGFLLAIACLGLSACGGDDETTCGDACETLIRCGTLEGSKSECEHFCNNDPTMTDGVRSCLAATSCGGINTCIAGPPASAAQCEAACSHVYGDCGTALADPTTGDPIPAEDCEEACPEGVRAEAAECLADAVCTSLNTCFR